MPDTIRSDHEGPIYYYISLADPAATAAAQAAHPDGIFLSPTAAAAAYSAPIGNLFSTSPRTWISEPQQYYSEADLDHPPLNVLKTLDISGPDYIIIPAFDFSYKWWESPSRLLQVFVHYHWIGVFLHSGPATPVAPPPVPLAVRYWHDGFETGGVAGSPNYTGGAVGEQYHGRDASRTAYGLGFPYRGGQTTIFHRTLDLTTGAVPPALKSSWERFYMRVRHGAAGEMPFWGMAGSLEGAGMALVLTLTGTSTIKVYTYGNSGYGARVLLGTFSLVGGLTIWNRLDLLFSFHQPGLGSFVDILVNGAVLFSYRGPVTASVGIDQTQISVGSTLGFAANVTTDKALEIDFDDWGSYVWDRNTARTGLDFVNGSHMVPLRANGDGSGRSGFAGDWRAALSYPSLQGSAASFTSATPNATLEVTTDYRDQQRGCASIVTALFSGTGIGSKTDIGCVIDGVSATINTDEAGNQAYQGSMKQHGGLLTPPAITAVKLRYVRNATAGSSTKRAFIGSAEMLGTWGPEDVPGPGYLPFPGLHNAPYPADFQASNAPTTAIGGYSVFGGTYVGNGTAQDLLPGLAIHWWFCRGVSAGGNAQGPAHWFSSMLAAHDLHNAAVGAEEMVQAVVENGVPKIRIVGANLSTNQNGITYYWIGVHDPARRFMLNGAFSHHSSLVAPIANPLWAAAFTPGAVFFHGEQVSVSSVAWSWYKGAGHTGNLASLLALNGAVPTAIATLAAGVITSEQPLHVSIQTAYNAWRALDDNGVIGCAITSYTGDGVTSRNIALALGNRAPVWAIVVPHNTANVVYRDPGSTGLRSYQLVGGGTPTDTGIIGGGNDFLTVGVFLNAAGVVYDVFALPGMNSLGWSPFPGAAPDPPGFGSEGPGGPPPEPPEPPPATGAACDAVAFPIDPS